MGIQNESLTVVDLRALGACYSDAAKTMEN